MKNLVHCEITESPQEIILYEWQKQYQALFGLVRPLKLKRHTMNTHMYFGELLQAYLGLKGTNLKRTGEKWKVKRIKI